MEPGDYLTSWYVVLNLYSDQKYDTTNIRFSLASSITSWQIQPVITGCHIHIPSLTQCQDNLSACPIWLLCTTTTRPSPQNSRKPTA